MDKWKSHLKPYLDKVGMTVLMNENITKNKRVEEELIKLSKTVSQGSVIVIIADLDGNIEYVIRNLNR